MALCQCGVDNVAAAAAAATVMAADGAIATGLAAETEVERMLVGLGDVEGVALCRGRTLLWDGLMLS